MPFADSAPTFSRVWHTSQRRTTHQSVSVGKHGGASVRAHADPVGIDAVKLVVSSCQIARTTVLGGANSSYELTCSSREKG
jgi:hypothetical protein